MKLILADAFEAFNQYSGWIIWNLFLAFIPFVLSFGLYLRPSRKRSGLWWFCFIIFLAFLPNAPYLLTDIIHLVEAIRADYSIWITTLIFIPLHLLAIFLGWEAYVISLINQSYYLKKQGANKFIVLSELSTHGLSAIGIYLGRFRRFNSWDLITQPNILLNSTIDDLTTKKPLLVIWITFIILIIFYWLTKQITLGTLWRIKQLFYDLDAKN
ncbi:DUF1361 domain-containing protein [Crocosphaera chwakensis]|uniref:DUF1361 domain-containing protein n=1 Tax=Crocosphaera chwakensis CCY0110 TaxID=391612 RepID=A3IWV9_9CHRO|nr:DUF1361 domain-containing protein [Crocosphaera chwakensis]EAZ89061.1 hypothetical protein CY0110_01420 [Crocosphaera chwakensis CCY0110]